MKNRLLLFLTPCMIAAVGLFVMIVDSLLFFRIKGDYNHIITLGAFLVSYLLIDYLLRRSLTKGLIIIWVIEIAIIILSAIVFVNSFPFNHFTVKH